MDDHDEHSGTRRAVKRVNYAELEDQYTDEEEEEDEDDEDEDDEDLEEQHQARGRSLRNDPQEALSEDEDEVKQEPTPFGRTLRDRRSITAPKPFPVGNPVSTRKPSARNSATSRRYEDDHNMYRSTARSLPPKRPPPVPRPIGENMRITRGMSGSLVPDSPSSRNSRDLTPDRSTRQSLRRGSSFGNQIYYNDEHGHESRHADEDEDVDEGRKDGQDSARNMASQGDDTGLVRMTRLRARNRSSLFDRVARGGSSSDEHDTPSFKRRSGESRSSSSRILPMNIGELAESRRDVIAMRGGQPADTDPLAVGNNVDFDKVGGLDHHIKSLKEMVILPLLYPEVYSHFQMMPPRGVLFHGPPGTGKTLLARALASSCSTETQKVAFFMRKGADCLSKWVGEAERQLRLLFEEAKAWQPSIIFFDEIDGLCPVRSSKQEQIHASIVSTMLALMDGLDGRGQVIVIGATNRIDAIDPALRRPGRFDREFYFPLPNESARRAIIDINTCGWQPPLDEKFKDELARVTTRYCGADIKALCTEAALKAIRRRYPQIYESNEKLLIDASSIVVEEVDMLKSAKSLTPASYRVTGATASPLPENVKPLLQEQLNMVCRAVETVFTGTSKRSAKGKDGDEDEDAAFQAMGYRSFEKLKTFRPRMIITGSRGMGQRYIGPALLHYLEGCTVQQFDLAALMSESSRTPEAACVQYFIEVKRHAPSVIYIPHIDVWWTVVSDAVKATFSNLLEDLNPEDGILFLATSESPLDGLPITIRRWFLSSAKGRIELSKPEAKLRTKFFEAVLQDLSRPPSDFKVKTTSPKALEPLPKAPPPQPRVPTAEEKKLLKEHDMYILRELRISLRTIVDELFKERKFKPFFRPVEPEESVDYYEIVKKPMDLTTITDKINDHKYLEVKEFLADIDQIVENATLYNDAQDPNRIVYRAQGFQDWAHSMVGRLDPELLVETEKTAARVRQELKAQKKVQGERMSRRQLGLEAPAVPDNPEMFLRNRFALTKLGVDFSREVSMDPVRIEVFATNTEAVDGKDGPTSAVNIVQFGQDDETETLTSVMTESSMAVSEAASEQVDGKIDFDISKQGRQEFAIEMGSMDVVMMEDETGDIETAIPISPIVRDMAPTKTASAPLANGAPVAEKEAEDDLTTLPLSELLERTLDQSLSQSNESKEQASMTVEEVSHVNDTSAPVEEAEEEEIEVEEMRELELDQDTLTKLDAALVLETEGSTVEELDQLRAALYADIWEHRHNWNKDALLMDMKQTLTSVTSLHRDYRDSEAQAVASFVEAFQ
ncbi:ATPase AAA domain-containing protein 2B [Podila clonocystis]|nr:ATPase AAA domain-containing protein 2B [Podila clonocystis]